MTRRVLVPTGVSLAVHAALILLLGAVTWRVFQRPVADEAAMVELRLESPAPAVEPAAEPKGPSKSGRAPAPATHDVPRPAPPPPPMTFGTVPRVLAPAPAPAMERPARIERPLAAGLASFAGVRADQVRDIVYVVDASGSMASSLPFVVQELKASIGRLGAAQRFSIVVFRDAEAINPDLESVEVLRVSGRVGLFEASPVHRAAASAWLDEIRPAGRSDPLAGLEAALALEPDAVFLLARSIPRTQDESWPARLEEAMGRLDAMNPVEPGTGRRRVLIKTIQFIDDDPTGLLQRIALEHGGGPGSYALRTLDQLGAIAAAPDASIRLDAEVDKAAEVLGRLVASGDDIAVLADAATEEERVRAMAAAREALDYLAGSPETDPFAQLLTARAALVLAAGRSREQSEALATRALERLDSIDPGLRWSAALARAWLAAVRGEAMPPVEEPPQGIDRHFVLEWRVQRVVGAGEEELAEALARAREAGAVSSAPRAVLVGRIGAKRAFALAGERPELWREGVAHALALSEQEIVHSDGATRRLIALDVLGAALPDEAPLDSLAPEATLARARVLAGDPERRREAEDLLRTLLVRPDAEHLSAEALEALAAILARDPQAAKRQQAVTSLLTLAELTSGAQAEDARQRALHLARSHVESARDDVQRRIALTSYEGALRTCLGGATLEHAAFWSSEYPRAALELAQLHSSAFSLHLLERIDPAAPETAAGADLYDRLVWPEVDGLVARYEEARRGAPDEAGEMRNAAARLLATASSYFQARGRPEAQARAQLALADLVVQEEPELAADLYAGVLASDVRLVRERDGVALDLAEVLAKLGRTEDAFGRVRPLLDQMTQPRGAADPLFWRAWTVAIEILAAENKGGARSGPIRAHLLRLRAIDAGLGGEPWRTRLARAEPSGR